MKRVEKCSRCFTLSDKGYFKRIFLKRRLRARGYIVFDERKLADGKWEMVISTRRYPNATILKRKSK